MNYSMTMPNGDTITYNRAGEALFERLVPHVAHNIIFLDIDTYNFGRDRRETKHVLHCYDCNLDILKFEEI